MAYIMGLLTPEEEQELERRGWELEPPPSEHEIKVVKGKRVRMVWVDVDMFDIMSGPDWDLGEIDEEAAALAHDRATNANHPRNSKESDQ